MAHVTYNYTSPMGEFGFRKIYEFKFFWEGWFTSEECILYLPYLFLRNLPSIGPTGRRKSSAAQRNWCSPVYQFHAEDYDLDFMHLETKPVTLLVNCLWNYLENVYWSRIFAILCTLPPKISVMTFALDKSCYFSVQLGTLLLKFPLD